MNSDFSQYEDAFLRYAEEFSDVPDAAPLRLKVEHTFRVYRHALVVVEQLLNAGPVSGMMLDEESGKAAVLAALFHDCGRFPQFRQYRTFLDASSVNHAELSFQVMRERKFLAGEPPEVRQLAETAVRLHNRYSLPEELAQAERLCTDIVRDSDKLDIFKVMVDYLGSALPERDAVLLHVADAPEKWTPHVAEQILEGKVGRYSDLRYVNDFRLLLGSWMYELRFPATRRALAESRLMEQVLCGLPDAEGLQAVKAKLRKELEACAGMEVMQ